MYVEDRFRRRQAKYMGNRMQPVVVFIVVLLDLTTTDAVEVCKNVGKCKRNFWANCPASRLPKLEPSALDDEYRN